MKIINRLEMKIVEKEDLGKYPNVNEKDILFYDKEELIAYSNRECKYENLTYYLKMNFYNGESRFVDLDTISKFLFSSIILCNYTYEKDRLEYIENNHERKYNLLIESIYNNISNINEMNIINMIINPFEEFEPDIKLYNVLVLKAKVEKDNFSFKFKKKVYDVDIIFELKREIEDNLDYLIVYSEKNDMKLIDNTKMRFPHNYFNENTDERKIEELDIILLTELNMMVRYLGILQKKDSNNLPNVDLWD